MHLTQNLKKMNNLPEGESKPYSLAGTNSVIKITLNHTHILRTLFMFPYDWSYDFGEAISTSFGLINPGVSNALSMECVLKNSNTKLEFLYFKLITNMVVPLIVGICFICFSFLKTYIRKRLHFRRKKSTNTEHLRRGGFSIIKNSMSEALIIRNIVKSVRRKLSIEAVFIIVYMMSWVDIARAIGHTLFHVNIGDDNSKSKRLLWQPNIHFESPQHQKWMFSVSIPSAIIFGFIFPAYLIYRLVFF